MTVMLRWYEVTYERELTLYFLEQRTSFTLLPSPFNTSDSKRDALLTTIYNNVKQFIVQIICYKLTK
jgi:hypothetical protein